ncbi:hypothetical protein tb265_41590 [Gemmatimonadetes bacterium T265]|nr:hypothetical protein tb265_41590 [Gemmatimonadetes bacterium T265]
MDGREGVGLDLVGEEDLLDAVEGEEGGHGGEGRMAWFGELWDDEGEAVMMRAKLSSRAQRRIAVPGDHTGRADPANDRREDGDPSLRSG